MFSHRTWPPLLAGALTAAALHAADDRDRAREQARGDYTVRGGPTGRAAPDMKPPLQTALPMKNQWLMRLPKAKSHPKSPNAKTLPMRAISRPLAQVL